MAIRRRTGLILVVTAAGVLVMLTLLVPVLLNLDRYRPDVISYLQKKTGKPVEVGRLALNLFPKVSIRVDDFGLKNPAGFPAGYFVTVKRIDAELDAAALLHRRVTIKSLVLKNPIINLVSDPDGPWNFENPQSSISGNTFPLGVISRVEIKRGQLSASNLLPSDASGLVFFEAHNVSSALDQVNLGEFTNASSSSIAAQGILKAGSLRFASMQATNVDSKLRLLAREVFFTDVRAEMYGGSAAGDLYFNFAGKNPSFKTNARMIGIDMAHLLAAFRNGRGKMTGRMEGDLKLAGEIEHSLRPLAGMHGTGHVTVRNGQVPSLKLNENLMKLLHFNDLGPAKQDPSSFSSISADLELANLRILSNDIDIVGYGVLVRASGSVSVTGSDSLDYQGVAEILAKQGFFPNIFAQMSGATSKEGRLSFPFWVGGTIQSPRFSKGKKPD